MKRLHIILIGIIISLSVASAAWSQETFTDEMEAQLLELINTARVNPLEMAEAVGMAPDQVLADLPWLYDELTQGLAPLRSDDRLTTVARSHTGDMLENDYYGHDSLDGSTPDDRLLASGYVAGITDESLGILGFFNFIDPNEAVFRIFSTLYRDELDPERIRPRNILETEFEDVGLGFGAGKLTLNGLRFNVYLVTCDFGTRLMAPLEKEILALMNQARQDPWEMALFLGMDPEQLMTDVPEWSEILTWEMPSLEFNEKLMRAAEDHTDDMVKNDYYGHQAPDGRTFADRMAESGYEAAVVAESLVRYTYTEPVSWDEAAVAIFGTLFRRELDAENMDERRIFNPEFVDVGVAVGLSQAEPMEPDETPSQVYVVTCDFGSGEVTDSTE